MSMNTLLEKITTYQNPTVAGLDPKLDYIPEYIKEAAFSRSDDPLDAAAQAAKAARDNNDATAERMEADLAEQGMTIVAEEEVDNAAFRDAVQSCYEEMESYVGSDWLAKIKSEVGLA